jgi:hypothetical protein
MQQQELAIKGGELERKKQKDMVDAQLKAEALRIQDKKVDVDAEAKGTELGAKIAKDKDAMDYKQEYEGTKLGMEIARDMANRKVNNDNSSRNSGQTD